MKTNNRDVNNLSAIPAISTNFHIWPISRENRLKKCSHSHLCCAFFKRFSHDLGSNLKVPQVSVLLVGTADNLSAIPASRKKSFFKFFTRFSLGKQGSEAVFTNSGSFFWIPVCIKLVATFFSSVGGITRTGFTRNKKNIFVIPAEAGIQRTNCIDRILDSCFRRNDSTVFSKNKSISQPFLFGGADTLCISHKSYKRNFTKYIAAILWSVPSFAMAAGEGDAISQVLSGLINLLQSGPAKLLFVVSIIGVGYGTLHLGKIPKEKAIAIVVGIGIVFSAAYIAKQLGVGG